MSAHRQAASSALERPGGGISPLPPTGTLRQAYLQALQVKAFACHVRLEEEIRAGHSEPFGLQTQRLQGTFEAFRAPASASSHDEIPHFEGLRGPLPCWQLPLQCWDT